MVQIIKHLYHTIERFSNRFFMQYICIIAVARITTSSTPVKTNISDWCLSSLSLKLH